MCIRDSMRTVRADPPDRASRPRWAPRYLRRLLQDAAGDLQPLPAAPAVLVRYRPEPCLHPMHSSGHGGLRALWERASTDSALAAVARGVHWMQTGFGPVANEHGRRCWQRLQIACGILKQASQISGSPSWPRRAIRRVRPHCPHAVSYTHLRAHETVLDLV